MLLYSFFSEVVSLTIFHTDLLLFVYLTEGKYTHIWYLQTHTHGHDVCVWIYYWHMPGPK